MTDNPKAKHMITVKLVKRSCESCAATEVAKRLGACAWCCLLVTDGARIWAHIGPIPNGVRTLRVLPKDLALVPDLLAIE